MKLWTHLAGGLVFGSLLGLVGAQPLSWIGWLGVAWGSAAPHLFFRKQSLPYSHSLLAALEAALVWALLCWLKLPGVPWLALGWAAGYLGHLLLDSMTVKGASLFWPSSVIAVLPKQETLRVEPGSPAERKLLFVLLGIALLLVPLQAVGLRGVLHSLVQTPQAAEEDYLRHAHQGYRVHVRFKGFHNASQRPVEGDWEAIHAPTANTLLVLDPNGRVHRIGNHPTDTIRPSKIRALRGEPVQVETREITLRHQPLGVLLKELPPDAQVFLTGWAILEEPVALNYSQEEFPTIAISDTRLEFTHAPIAELTRQRLSGVEILRGYLLIRIVRGK